MSQMVLMSTQERITTITLNRLEKRNAMDGHLVQQLLSALDTTENDKQSGVIILRANGDHFCAGADIGWMQKVAQSPKAENQQDAMLLARLLYRLYTFSKPVIVLAKGVTFGGGLGIVAASDIAIAATNASFAFSEVKIGIVPSVVSPYVIAAMGERAARYYFLTAARFGAHEAHRMGFVHQVIEPEALDSAGKTLAKEILQHSQCAVSEAKRLITHVAREQIDEELIQYTANHLADMRTKQDAQEGLRAFLERRTPSW